MSGLTYFHPADMVFHMKTTLNINDTVMTRLRQHAARSGRTISELVESALRRFLQEPRAATRLPRLPAFDGGARMDVANRGALHGAMKGR